MAKPRVGNMRKNIKHCSACVIFSFGAIIEPKMETFEYLACFKTSQECFILEESSFEIVAAT